MADLNKFTLSNDDWEDQAEQTNLFKLKPKAIKKEIDTEEPFDITPWIHVRVSTSKARGDSFKTKRQNRNRFPRENKSSKVDQI